MAVFLLKLWAEKHEEKGRCLGVDVRVVVFGK
jgi:hypothetical protein